ncbi:MAG: serine/threonine protein kinase [Deltaproteobacteria bacterium]|nr:MAG: serine/threonine protein kinase [Deltaproteobacteria bacterium]
MSFDLEQRRQEDVADLAPGTQITLQKRFKIVGRLGEGGMGKVFKAFDPIMNRYLALKVMKTDVPESQQRRFRLEARLCGQFMHPNLVRVLDVGTTREHGLFWFAMEFLEGRDIRGAMGAGRAVPLHVAVEIFRQVLDALRYVHLRQIVHRDIKPANIFVSRDPVDPELRLVKLLDFGVAKDLKDEQPEDPNLILGDPAYLAPEQAIPNGPIDGRADLYALGMTFFEAVTGHHPFEHHFDEHPRELIRAHRFEEPPPPSRYLAAAVSPQRAGALDRFFARACAKDPNARYPDARAMQADLLEIGQMA